MSIRAKLLLVIGVLIIAFAASVVFYFVLRSRAGAIQSEQTTLLSLRTALLAEGFEANGLASAPLSDQKSAFARAAKETDSAFGDVKTLKLLAKMSPLIASALVSIQQLQTLLDTETTELLGGVSDIQRDATDYYGAKSNSSYSVYQLLTDLQNHKSALFDQTSRHMQSLVSLIGSVASDFQAAITVIDSQDSLIASEIQRIESRSNAYGIVMMFLLFVAAVLLSLFLSRKIVQSIKLIAGDVAQMREGDITRTFTANTRDEIGTLASDLGSFVVSLKDSISNIQNVSTENVRMKEDLIATTEQTSASATQIAANAESINHQISMFDDSVVIASNAVRTIGTGMKELDTQIEEESSQVEGSIAAVTAMISLIDGVTKTAEERRVATEKLTTTVSAGGEKMHATFELVNEINDSVGSIEEITTIIEGLSSQTNLLAMNAAIEAAHAGDAGRGFSVVADEIRKLAEASSTNSHEISRILKSIVERVSEAGTSSSQMNRAFGEIDSEVQGVSSSLAEIFSSMQDLRAGGIREISSAVDNVLTNATRLGELGESLNRDLSKFRTD